jgi:choline dehydrogenase-like flavoprotein
MSETFDYIVVGGGSAGCVAANRLSADPQHTVCLIEAGEDQEPMVHEADQWFKLQAVSELHWGITTPPQEHLDNRPIDCAQARLAGGCGSHNASQYVRGSRFDYDGWAEDYGCSKWTWQEMLPLLAGLETYEEGPK